MYKIIDTFNDFIDYWSFARLKNIEEKVELWENLYMKKYPELLRKQTGCYKEIELDWKKIFKEKILPKLEDYIPLMQRARENLIKICGSIYEQAVKKIGLNFDVIFVIYVGIGCGAGWATEYDGFPASLFGLEKIVELNWHTQKKLKGLICHELGHLIHVKYRKGFKKFEKEERDTSFLLYSEGFAKRFEYLILGEEIWNEADDENWLLWCKEHKKYLAKEYLSRINNKINVNDFFGDLLSIKGKRQTGYFLGYEFIRWLEKNYNIMEISVLPFGKIKELVREYLILVD